MRLVCLLLAIATIVGCSHIAELDPGKIYNKTLTFSVNGQPAVGILAAKHSASYRLDFQLPQKPDLLKLTTCHREMIFHNPGKALSVRFDPYAPLEAGDLPCTMEISALDVAGANQWGLVTFPLGGETLAARIYCNGAMSTAVGSNVCQSRADLIQAIEFEEAVEAWTPSSCPEIRPNRGTRFYYPTADGSCFLIFSAASGATFRLHTFGYNEIVGGENT